jgi:hypothetical protein
MPDSRRPRAERTTTARPVAAGRGGGLTTRARLLVGALLLAALAVVGYVALGPTGASRTEAARLEHVHGLGVNPADGALHAGTHTGLFRLPEDGAPERVAGRVQDFMGFAVVGPDHFIASGHPGEGQDGPASVGLIETTDGGRTWQSLSLAGEADFHALDYRHGRVYGVNAMTGELMVSEDRRAWEVRSTVPIADIAVSPADPEVLLATTADGLARSEDGGRTFRTVGGAPLLLLVSWAEDGTIVGVDPDGTVHRGSDAGDRWTRGATLEGAPEALDAHSRDRVHVAAGGEVLTSTDGGSTFSVGWEG